MGRVAVGPQGSTAARVLREGRQTCPAPKATGRPVMVSHVPATAVCLCGWNPKLQSADVLTQPPSSIFSGVAFAMCGVFPLSFEANG